MPWVLTLLLLFSIAKAAAQEGINPFIYENRKSLTHDKSGQLKEFRSDTNLDGKSDIVDRFDKSGRLQERIEDRNLDGEMDAWTIYRQQSSEVTQTKTDLDFDGRVDTIEITRSEKKHYKITKMKLDSKTGKFKVIETNYVDKNKSTAFDLKECVIGLDSKDEFRQVSQFVDSISKGLFIENFDGDFHQTNWGYAIHKSCFNSKKNMDFPLLLTNMLNETYKCLSDLNTPQSRAHIHRMASLLLNKENPTKISCEPPPGEDRWDDNTFAQSSTPNDESHPLISVNLNVIKSSSTLPFVANREFKATVFHETFHNMGYLHGRSIEYPYACQSCCYDQSVGSGKKNACDICKGSFSGPTDKSYMTNLVSLNKKLGRSSEDALLDYVKANPNDPWGKIALAGIIDYPEDEPLAIAYAEVFSRESLKLTAAEKATMDRVLKRANRPENKAYLPFSRPLIESKLLLAQGKFAESEQKLAEAFKSRIDDNNVTESRFYRARLLDTAKKTGWSLYFKYIDGGEEKKAVDVFEKYLKDK